MDEIEKFAMILKGDNRELITEVESNSMDAIVTDPPYGLGKEPDAVQMLIDWVQSGHHEVRGKGFMGKPWDAFVPQPKFWAECFRVLKPGAYLVSFGGTRTFDLISLGLRLAGFEYRDTIMWVYGTGFSKSMDISKAMDKHLGVEREVLSTLPAGHGPLKTGHVNASGGGMSIGTDRSPEINVTEPTSDEAKEWAGWGTALKPAYEPILIFRKPLEGTVCQNVLKWGVGGINIDGSRVPLHPGDDAKKTVRQGRATASVMTNKTSGYGIDDNAGPSQSGRFPANFIHDGSEEVLENFPHTKSGKSDGFKGEHTAKIFGEFANNRIDPENVYGDQGSSARFFYCAKATQAERKGSKHPTIKPKALIDYLVKMVSKEGHTILDPFGGPGTTYEVCLESGRQCVIMERDEESIKDIKARIHGIQTRIV